MYTRQELEQYITWQTKRQADSASAWMKAECQKAIDLAKSELAKLNK